MAVKPPIRRTADDHTWESYRDAFFGALPDRERVAFEAWARTFYKFQLEWLFEPEDFALCNKSRQTGFSHTTGGLGSMWGIAFGETTTLVSVGEREAKEVLEKAKNHAAMLRDFGSKWAEVRGKDSAEEVRFSSGGRLIALPQTSAGRSFSGNVFLDEFAYLARPKEVWDGAAAVTLHGYRMRVASTPNGVGNEFHRLATDPVQHSGWAIHEIPIQRAIADGMRVDISRCWKMAKGDRRLYSQLFECKFLDGQLQYIPTDAIEACKRSDLYTYDGEYYAGLDIGRTNDLTALVIVRLVGEVAYLVALHTCKRTDQAALDELVQYAFLRYNVAKLAVDATGMGAFPAENMQREYGRTRVLPIQFTKQSKEDLASTMFQFFVSGNVLVPERDESAPDFEPGGAEALTTDVCSVQRIITSAGNIRYDAPHTDDGHADRAWALALALHATGRKPSVKFVDETR
jgi:phage FluMu gp28-like protein